MDAEIKAEFQKVGERFDSLETRIDGLETRIGGLEARMGGLETRISGLETRMDGFVEQMRDMETTILREFHKWASPMEQRFRGQTSLVLAHDQEIADLKDRVKALERKAS